MTSDKRMFETFEYYDGNCVKFGNDEPYLVKGKGCIKLNERITCDNAYFVEGLNYNFLSVAQLNSSGYKVEFHQKKAKIYNKKGDLVGKGETKGNLFYLNLTGDDACLIVKFDDAWLWNKRLCHVNFDSLVSINKMQKVRDLPKLKMPDNAMCSQC